MATDERESKVMWRNKRQGCRGDVNDTVVTMMGASIGAIAWMASSAITIVCKVFWFVTSLEFEIQESLLSHWDLAQY